MSKTIAQLEAELTEIRGLLAGVRSGGGDAVAIGQAVGDAIKKALRPSTQDQLDMVERPAGEARTIVDAVSQVSGAKFKALLRPDGSCEAFVNGSYIYPEAWSYGKAGHGAAWGKMGDVYTRDASGQVTENLTAQAKQLRTVNTWQKDLITYISRRLNDGGHVFPVEARADMQDRMQKLRDLVAAEAKRLADEAGPLVPPAG